MKLRIIVRKGIADYDGRCAAYEYRSEIVEVPDWSEIIKGEVIGGEWLPEIRAREAPSEATK